LHNDRVIDWFKKDFNILVRLYTDILVERDSRQLELGRDGRLVRGEREREREREREKAIERGDWRESVGNGERDG
jgi:hypothetical protein